MLTRMARALLLRRLVMRTTSCQLSLLLFTLIAGCSDEDGAKTITITSSHAPSLVMFRDGLEGPWQAAVENTPNRFEAAVHGPYLVTVVCEGLPFLGVPELARTVTWQAGRTLEDPHELTAPCAQLPSTHTVTGHMTEAGAVQLGSSQARSRDADWDFSLAVERGSYDLIATTEDAIAIRRAIQVSGDLAIASPIDVAHEGTALVDVSFTAPDVAADETLEASVGLLNPTNPDIPARIYLGAPATAKAAPDTALIATDIQSVSFRARKGAVLRALRRPYRVGGQASFELPPAIGGAQWTVEGGQLSVSWSTLPELELLAVSAASSRVEGTSPSHALDLSRHFLAAIGVARATLDTELPGYKPEWRVDFTGAYNRSLLAQQGTEQGTLSSSMISDQLEDGVVVGEANPAPARVTRF